MKELIISLLFFLFCSLLFADFPRENFLVFFGEEEIHLGDEFGKIIDILGKEDFNLHSYSNITLREYKYDNLVISTSNSEAEESKNRIYGIYFTSKEYSIVEGISIESRITDIIEAFGQPDVVYKGSYYFYNEEFDVIELKFTFDPECKVNSIQIFMGT